MGIIYILITVPPYVLFVILSLSLGAVFAHDRMVVGFTYAISDYRH